MTVPVFEPIKSITSRFVYFAQENIDTDQIIPARFLTTTTREGLGKNLFYYWRYDENGVMKSGALLNQAATRQAKILVAGRNFGCGSSREHAPWALYDYGFRVIISPKLGDIFRSNCLKNGLLAVEIADHIFCLLTDVQDQEITVNLQEQTISIVKHQGLDFSIDEFARACLIEGNDQLGFLLANMSAIETYEESDEHK